MKKLFLIFILTATVSHAEIYKWTDKEGAVHFTDSVVEIPVNYRKSIQPVEMGTNEPTVNNKAVSPIEPPQNTSDNGSVAPNVGDLKERMMKDEGIMSLISAMQNDQELQVLLQDPAIVRAVQTGDISALQNNPDFLKILNNTRVKEIENRLNNSETK